MLLDDADEASADSAGTAATLVGTTGAVDATAAGDTFDGAFLAPGSETGRLFEQCGIVLGLHPDQVRKRPFSPHLHLRMNILPGQARDKIAQR